MSLTLDPSVTVIPPSTLQKTQKDVSASSSAFQGRKISSKLSKAIGGVADIIVSIWRSFVEAFLKGWSILNSSLRSLFSRAETKVTKAEPPPSTFTTDPSGQSGKDRSPDVQSAPTAPNTAPPSDFKIETVAITAQDSSNDQQAANSPRAPSTATPPSDPPTKPPRFSPFKRTSFERKRRLSQISSEIPGRPSPPKVRKRSLSEGAAPGQAIFDKGQALPEPDRVDLGEYEPQNCRSRTFSGVSDKAPSDIVSFASSASSEAEVEDLAAYTKNTVLCFSAIFQMIHRNNKDLFEWAYDDAQREYRLLGSIYTQPNMVSDIEGISAFVGFVDWVYVNQGATLDKLIGTKDRLGQALRFVEKAYSSSPNTFHSGTLELIQNIKVTMVKRKEYYRKLCDVD